MCTLGSQSRCAGQNLCFNEARSGFGRWPSRAHAGSLGAGCCVLHTRPPLPQAHRSSQTASCPHNCPFHLQGECGKQSPFPHVCHSNANPNARGSSRNRPPHSTCLSWLQQTKANLPRGTQGPTPGQEVPGDPRALPTAPLPAPDPGPGSANSTLCRGASQFPGLGSSTDGIGRRPVSLHRGSCPSCSR